MKEMKRILSLVLCFVMLVGLMPNLAFAAEGTPVVVVAGSDFQNSSGDAAGGANVTKIMNQMGYSSVNGVLFGGDYSYSMSNSTNLSNLDGYMDDYCATAANRIYIQGNHDTNLSPSSSSNLLAETGSKDTDDYGVYVINYSDFGSAASGLQTYLNGKTGYTKPIFVLSHQPLHVTSRGDNTKAVNLFNVLNNYEDLNIIFLFGHNHSGGFDAYLGNGAIYLPKGSNITVAGGSTSKLNFTYMNYGYVGYISGSSCTHLTMTAFEIYEDEVIIKRYGTDGQHLLKEKGATVSGYNTDANEYGYAVLNLSTGESTTHALSADGGDDNTGSGDNSGTTGGSGNVYKLDTDGVTTGEDYLIVSAGADGTAQALRNNNGSVSSAEVTISNGQIVTDAADIVWTYDDNKYLSNDGQYIYLTYNNSISFDASEPRAMAITSNNAGEGAYTVKRDGDSYNYYLNYSNTSWTCGGSADDIYFFVRTSETGSGDNSGTTGGGTTVTPEGGNWVTLTEPDGGTTTYTYTQATSITANGKYVIVANDAEIALLANGTTMEAQGVDITGNSGSQTMTSTTELTLWTFSGTTSGTVYNGTNYLYSSGSSPYTFRIDSKTDTLYFVDNGNNFTIKASSDRTGYSFYYDGSDWATSSRSSAQNVRLYKLTETTPGDDATPGLYGKLDGELVYTVPYGADADTALAKVKAGIDILYHYGDANAAETYPDDGEGMSWVLASNYDGTVPGEYAVVISYNGIKLGTAKVIVPNVGIQTEDVLYYIDETLTAPIGQAVVEGTPANGTYNFEILGGDEIITSIDEDGTIHFNGTEGTAQVKITYTYADGDNSVTLEKTINVTATKPYFTINLHKQDKDENGNPIAGEDITAPVALKGVQKDDTYHVWAVVKEYSKEHPDGESLGNVEDDMIEWTSSDESIATVDPSTGVITFTGKDGTVQITATYKDGNKPSDTITISATASQYTVPNDGTTDFPEYPNEGAIRYDKTATAVGNFSETGIAQIELSMTGVPYTKGSEIDVVLMLDRSRSMSQTRIDATVAATEAFIKGIVKNKDGSYNGNRIYLGYFMGSTTYDISDSGNIGGALATIDSDAEFNALIADLKAEYKAQMNDGGTDWQIGLERSENLLNAAKTDGIGSNRPKFCVFMSDGAPSDYRDLDNNSSSHTTGSSWVTNGSRNSSYKYELYSTRMKGSENITIYSVLLGEDATQPQFLMNDLSGPAGETTNDTGSAMSKLNKYYYLVPDANAAADMEKVFSGIAVSILQAATDVTVEDKITDDYTMIFDIPEGSKDITGVTNDFYIEFVKYTLDADHERTDDVTSVTKLYLKNTNGNYSAASNSEGADYATPVFAQSAIGEKGTLYFWTTDSGYASKAAVTYTNDDGTYYFIPYGMEKNEDGTAPANWYNMTSGAYASGTVDATTNMSENLVIATPYFVYNASTRMLYWTVEKLDTAEYALRYFLYLDDSATEVGTDKETDPGSYLTNDHAYITYTNFQNNECRQEFPKPQMTWSGAQVSYVFYLVNAQGQPINKSGQVVDFANATFVTEIYTEHTVWNKGEDGQITADSKLSINWLAEELLPSDYKVYDEQASYKLHVYGSHTGESIFDYFTIGGNDAATISASLNNRLAGVNTTASTVSLATTKVYNTKAGEKITGYGTYTSEATDSLNNEIVLNGFDFYNTTVAFAVVWQPSLAPDTVVVDYGLDVLINVCQNDLMQDNSISGIGLSRDAYGNIAMNTGISTGSVLGTNDLTLSDGSSIHIENGQQIRFSQNDMTFENAVTFYYESETKYYEASEQKTGYLHSSVTVIPATTIYYEDEFVDLKTYTSTGNTDENGKTIYNEADGWASAGTASGATQAQDRPGTTLIAGVMDADNNYGYDAAYAAMSTHSLNSAAMVNVTTGKYATAEFTFYGTGFDVISMTSNTTGTLTVKVLDESENAVKNMVVDTYYGYTRNDAGEWVATPDTENALYQVPVIKVQDLPYAKYTVVITASYVGVFDHNEAEAGYDLYLDAIRIYDPANDGAGNTTIEDAYVKDGEGWPSYFELRNKIISAEGITTDENGNVVFPEGAALDGPIFIDGIAQNYSIADYVSYGPNNEVYLAKGQSISFLLSDVTKPVVVENEDGSTTTEEKSIVAKIQLGIKSANGTAVTYTIQNADKDNAKTATVSTATDMYYDITEWKEGVIVITNTGDGILSLTNIKATYTENPNAAAVAAASEDELENTVSAMPETNEVYAYMTPAAATMTLRSLNRAAVVEPEETEPETTEPETTEPETTEPETTEPETTEPETTEPETTEPETTEPETTEPETTEPEETEPEEPSTEEVVKEIVKEIIKVIGRWFGKWF